MILRSQRHHTEEEVEGYRLHSRLTIKSVIEADYGAYKCVSKNSLGETEGQIRLYGEQLDAILRKEKKTAIIVQRLYQSQPLRRQHSRQDRLDRTVTLPGNPSPTTQGYQATRGAGSHTEIQGQHSQKSRKSGTGAVEVKCTFL